MRTVQVLQDGFGRVREVVHEVADGLTEEQLAERVEPDANPVGWLLWHLTRVQDASTAKMAGTPEVWTAGGAQGLLGTDLPEELGGGGVRDFRFNAVLGEESMRVGATGVGFTLHNDVVAPYLRDLATPEQQRRWLPSVHLLSPRRRERGRPLYILKLGEV